MTKKTRTMYQAMIIISLFGARGLLMAATVEDIKQADTNNSNIIGAASELIDSTIVLQNIFERSPQKMTLNENSQQVGKKRKYLYDIQGGIHDIPQSLPKPPVLFSSKLRRGKKYGLVKTESLSLTNHMATHTAL